MLKDGLLLLDRFVPESARWLVSRNRNDEALKIISKAAEVNKVKLPADLTLEQEVVRTVSLRTLLSAKALLCRTLIIFLNW